jgi:DNA modification methylase
LNAEEFDKGSDTMENNENFEEAVIAERKRLGSEKRRQKDTARLVWSSKPRKEPSAKDLTFQTAEIVFPNKATGPLSSYLGKEKLDIQTKPNRMIWGDNLLIMQALLSQGYEGQIDLIYIDPPFNTGENFNFPNDVRIGNKQFERELPMSERLAYTDTWDRGLDSFLDMLYPRLLLMKRLLTSTGSIFVHLDSNTAHYVKVLLDEIFGKDKNFRNEIVWFYPDSPGRSIRDFPSKHDSVFRYVKDENNWTFNDMDVRVPILEESKERYKTPRTLGGRIYTGGVSAEIGKIPEDVWRMPVVKQNSGQALGYPTQKPETLIERIILSSSNLGDMVADFFCGSGTTASVAEKFGRKWITTDISKTAIQVTRSRLVSQGANSFLIENLGNYQRQLIYLHEVKLREIYSIILKLYGASPREDKQGMGISNTDRNTLVYVCEPDRPMTARKAVELSKDASALDGRGYKNLVILAWDYDYNYDEDLKKFSSSRNSKIESKIIPSDVYKYLRSPKVGDPSLVDKITFHQKPYLKVSEPEIIDQFGDEVAIKISIAQYVVMDNPIMDEEKRKEAEELLKKNYAYLIDFWAVDWDYDSKTFKSMWQAIRNRKSMEPVVTIADFRVKKGREYNIAIRVVDVFGNDASAFKKIDLR